MVSLAEVLFLQKFFLGALILTAGISSESVPAFCRNELHKSPFRQTVEEVMVRRFFYEREKKFFKYQVKKSLHAFMGFGMAATGLFWLGEKNEILRTHLLENGLDQIRQYYRIVDVLGLSLGVLSAISLKYAVELVHYSHKWLCLVRKGPLRFEFEEGQ
jgi:hypothetical protein